MVKIFKYISLLMLLIFMFIFGCPILKLFNITCPTCGVTHAWIFILSGEIKLSFKSNPLFLPLSVMFLRIIYCDIKKCSFKKVEFTIYCGVVILSFAFNLIRILNGL